MRGYGVTLSEPAGGGDCACPGDSVNSDVASGLVLRLCALGAGVPRVGGDAV